MPRPNAGKFVWMAVVVLGALAVRPPDAHGSLRRVREGQEMPSFSLMGPEGKPFVYDPNHKGALAIVVMKAGQPQLPRIAADLEPILEAYKAGGKAFDCIGVVSGPDAKGSLQGHDAGRHPNFRLLLDPGFELWGKLGVIAAPTAVVVGPDRRVQWAKGGYGYDFVPSFHAQLAKALGLRAGADASTSVATLSNTSNRARLERHVQMARTLVKKGRFESAIAELRKAQSLHPNSLDIVFEFGELLCRTGENEAALKVAAEARARTGRDKARVLLISGWARRQLGQLDAAEALLVEALELDRQYPRIPYELGKVYQAKGEFEMAARWYRRALERLYDEPVKAALPSGREAKK